VSGYVLLGKWANSEHEREKQMKKEFKVIL
jgi:hypothetical protein